MHQTMLQVFFLYLLGRGEGRFFLLPSLATSLAGNQTAFDCDF
jgi:hypothetical protein